MKKVSPKLRLIFVLGIVCSPASQILNRYFSISDVFFGVIQGVGIGLLLIFIIQVIRDKKRQKQGGIIE